MAAPAEIIDLINRFEQHLDAYKAGQYNETRLRRDFLDPFFKALGWDIDNTAGYAEAYRDVIHEDQIRVGGAVKAPDYCFRIGSTRKFFLEAKKPSVFIKEEIPPAYQLRRYGWNAKLPLSLLSDFEEFAIYDCRFKPHKDDKASIGRIFYCTFKDYSQHWDYLAGIFSRDAVLRGSFDKFAETNKAKRGTTEVDADFLATIEGWRKELAQNLALRNPRLTQRELNFAVQRLIDRLIFLRICEDRGIEDYGRLRGLGNGERIYPRLCQLFEAADDRYNSGLFHFKNEPGRHEAPDELTLGLEVDDRLLRDILKNLYYPDSPYEFSILSADILGQVYEQFLGKVIRLTEGHRAVVEEKPEVKKAGGVYYTPTYIVDYIVRQTVGKLLDECSSRRKEALTDFEEREKAGKRESEPAPGTIALSPAHSPTFPPAASPREAARVLDRVAKLRILDPACGSGSFLIGAYQHLLDWHLQFYTANEPERWARGRKPALVQTTRGWRLTIAERKRILLNNIYGVDIDSQAVEVTKLSLLLKVLEGETHQSLAPLFAIFHERALPDLGDNIKCGNSLIGPDFYDEQQLNLLDDEERYRLNVFDWRKEFADTFKTGGFEAVIGNPPWGQKGILASDDEKHYLRAKFPSSAGIYDVFRPFVEQGLVLLKHGGAFGMVLPDIVLLKDYPETRLCLLDNLKLTAVDWWGMAFANAVIDAATVTGKKETAPANHCVAVAVHDPEQPVAHSIRQADFRENPRYVFNLHLTPAKKAILQKLEALPRLGDWFEVHEGVHSGNIRAELFVATRVDASCRQLLFGRDELEPYHLRWNGAYIRCAAAPARRSKRRYANLGRAEWYEQDKVLVRRTGDYVLAAVDREHRYASNNFFIVFPRQLGALGLDGLCALLNSEFMTWYFRTIEPRKGRVFAELKIKHLAVFPLPKEIRSAAAMRRLNELGAERARMAARTSDKPTLHDATVDERTASYLDDQIEKEVRSLLGISGSLPE